MCSPPSGTAAPLKGPSCHAGMFGSPRLVSDTGAASNILPGLRMPFGSSILLISNISDRSCALRVIGNHAFRSEEHTSELQSLMRISYAVFCLKKKTYKNTHKPIAHYQNLSTT